jgi:hypothetical protein
MEIKLNEIEIRDVVKGYIENPDDNSVFTMDGKLNIRPAYQREFVYDDAKRNAVIQSINKGFPLNVMYWVKDPATKDHYEVLDGQQRTISICQYVCGFYSVDNMYFSNLAPDEQEKILSYKLMIYKCEGTPSEVTDWFYVINIAGMPLFKQEIRNAVYKGTWLTDAKRYFSRKNCPAYSLASRYLNGVAIRQDYLETAISWACSSRSDDSIREYMAQHQHDSDAHELWLYFKKVIDWVEATFMVDQTKDYYPSMKGVEWGFLYNQYKDKNLVPSKLCAKIKELIKDDEVDKKSGIYEYILDGQEKHLSLRAFSDSVKEAAYAKQNGICPMCKDEGGVNADKQWKYEEMEGDHKQPWHSGGKTVPENCQMLCKHHNKVKNGF